ncbi:MAG: hypothetical protein NVSMB2_21090 [Chloroflexota bacterium]
MISLAIIGIAFAPPPASSELQIARDSDGEPSRELPAQVALPLSAPPIAPAAGSITSASTTALSGQLPAATFDPRLAVPQWLHLVRDATLWSSGGVNASVVGSLAGDGLYVKPLGPFVDTRLQVYFPGDGSRPAAQGWIDMADVEPSSVPNWIAPASEGRSPAAPRRINDAAPPDTSAVYVAIVDDASGALLYGDGPHSEVPQASTTKIATTIVALEHAPDLTRRIPVTVSASAMVARDGSSTMGLEPGYTVSLKTLLLGMMLPSGNDAAEQVAVSLADSRTQFVDWMNLEAAALGLKNTHFANPSGMDADGHYSSAYDMAMLARYAMHNASFRDLAGTVRSTSEGFPMHNLNRLLESYPGVDGVKIGYTDAAQKTIVASATRNGHHVYVSLMHSQDLVGDCSALFDWVWDSFAW